MAPADQTTEPDGVGDDTDALVRALGVAAGHRLDNRYRLDRVLHPTGTAVTWLATDEKLNRLTRIHLLRSDEPRAQAFMAAARAAAAMPDNHFVQVLDAVPDDGLYYVITEWLHDGTTLGDILAAGQVPVHEAVRITTELARAMTEAHDSGLAHLRLSPKTVLRTDTGEVKILDLCLAAALTGTVSRDPLGTDLAAIGELAYAMLTGKRPQDDPAPPSKLRPDVPAALDEVVLRTLGDPSAGEAYQTPMEVVDALAKLPRPRYEEPMRSTPQTAPLRHAQTQVMKPTNQRALPPAYEQTSVQPDPRPTAVSHGGSHRPPSTPSYDGGGHRGGRGGLDVAAGGANNRNMKIGVGAVAAVAVVSLLAWQVMGGGGKKTNANGAGGSGGTTSQSASSSSSAPAGGPIVISGVSLYDADDGTEDAGSVNNLLPSTNSTKGWGTQSYCTAQPTYNGGHAKAGTGIVFDLGAAKQITTATVAVPVAGGDMEMWVGDSTVTAAPAEVGGQPPAGFKKVAEATPDSTTVTLTAAPATAARFVLIWFTKLPAEPTKNAGITCAHSDGHTYADTLLSVKFS